VHLFLNALICASTVLECSCCRIHRYVAAPIYKVVFGWAILLLLQWRWPAEHADCGGGGRDDVVAMLHVYKVVFGWVMLLLLLQWRWPAEHADGGGG
jgi:hypothetical protein